MPRRQFGEQREKGCRFDIGRRQAHQAGDLDLFGLCAWQAGQAGRPRGNPLFAGFVTDIDLDETGYIACPARASPCQALSPARCRSSEWMNRTTPRPPRLCSIEAGRSDAADMSGNSALKLWPFGRPLPAHGFRRMSAVLPATTARSRRHFVFSTRRSVDISPASRRAILAALAICASMSCRRVRRVSWVASFMHASYRRRDEAAASPRIKKRIGRLSG